MNRYAILNGEIVVEIVEANAKPVFHPSVIVLDITTNPNGIEVGWELDSESGVLTPPSPIVNYPPEPLMKDLTVAQADMLCMATTPDAIKAFLMEVFSG